jgi:hypothetical protein
MPRLDASVISFNEIRISFCGFLQEAHRAALRIDIGFTLRKLAPATFRTCAASGSGIVETADCILTRHF